MKRKINVLLFQMILISGLSVAYGRGKAVKSSRLDERVGVCTTVSKVPLLQKAGCSFVEIGIRDFFVPEKSDATFEANLEAAGKSALPVYSGNSFFPGTIRLVGPDVDRKAVMDYTEIIMKRAGQSQTKILVLGSGGARRIPDGFKRRDAEMQFVDLCRGMAEIAQRHGVIIVLEPLRKEETNFLNTVREGMKIVKAVDHPNLKILADFYHMACEGEDPGALVEAGVDLFHCHIAEVAERTAPGRKGDDFTPYLRALKKIGYKGAIALECRWKQFDDEVGNAVKETKRQIVSVYGSSR